MRILFLGSGPFGIPTLQRLHALRTELVVATVPDAARGRSKTLRPSAIKEEALSLGLEVNETERLRGREGQDLLEKTGADLVITADIRLILGPRFLEGPTRGCFNLHGSILPRWRGAAPIVRALLAGDEQLGVTLYRMVPALDAGPVVASHSWTPPATITAEVAEQQLSQLAADLLEQWLEALEKGSAPQLPQQDDLVTLAPRVEKAEGWAHWNGSSSFVERQVRALKPWPKTRTRVTRQTATNHRSKDQRSEDQRSEELILHQVSTLESAAKEPAGTVLQVTDQQIVVACGKGAVSIEQMQRIGKKPLKMTELLRGMPFQPGDRFHSEEVSGEKVTGEEVA